jgi:Flp pilus assembly protein TadG
MLRKKRKNKVSLILEFTLILPFILLLITFSIDMGRTVMTSTGLHDSASIAARAGARQGIVGSYSTANPCKDNYLSMGPVYSAFCQSVNSLPGLTADTFSILTPRSPTCKRNNGNPTDPELYITVRATAHVDYITPGLNVLLNTGLGSKSNVTVTGVAKCEVAFD